MTQPPSPPQKATQYLQELGEYYRELIDYHQQAALAAAQQLSHVEALLLNDPALPTQQVQSWLLDEFDHEDDLEIVGNEKNKSEIQELILPTDKQLNQFFREERGNMVQIDYILHHFFDIGEQPPQHDLKELLTEQLKKGSSNQLWSQVPDAPDCWTFSLSDFAEFAPPSDNPLFPEFKSELLPTKKVADFLSIKAEKIYEIKNIYGSELIQGSDYFQNNRGHYLWTEKGVKKLSDLRNQLDSTPQPKNSTLPSSPPQMLPSYKGLAMEKAIKKLFNSNPDREWTISQVVTGIYGNLTKTQASFVRDKITKGLSKGHLTGLWRRVPRKVGVYRPN